MGDNSDAWTPRSDKDITVRISGLEDFAGNMTRLQNDMMDDIKGLTAVIGDVEPPFGAGGLAEGGSFRNLHGVVMKAATQAMLDGTLGAHAFANSAGYIASHYVDSDHTSAQKVLSADTKLPSPFEDTGFKGATTDDVLNSFMPPEDPKGGGDATVSTVPQGDPPPHGGNSNGNGGGLDAGYNGGDFGEGRDRMHVPANEMGNDGQCSPIDGDPTKNVPRLNPDPVDIGNMA